MDGIDRVNSAAGSFAAVTPKDGGGSGLPKLPNVPGALSPGQFGKMLGGGGGGEAAAGGEAVAGGEAAAGGASLAEAAPLLLL